jgi:hypothetical protein
VTARRPLRLADDLDAFAFEEVVPPLKIADVEREVRLSDAIPRNVDGGLLWLEVKDLEHGTARYSNPSNLALRQSAVHLEECPHTIGRGVCDANQRAAKDLPVELHEPVEIGNGDADVTE